MHNADFDIHAAIAVLQQTMPEYPAPLIDGSNANSQTPFRILIATILSLRTKDTLTAVVAPRLFAAADTPETMLALSEEQIAALIYPVGFYRNKARSARSARCCLSATTARYPPTSTPC
jgi:endonuclease III